MDALCLQRPKVIQTARDGRCSRTAVCWRYCRFQKQDLGGVCHDSPYKNKKPTYRGFRRWVGYNLVVKGFLQSWLFTSTRHSGPRRHLGMTTTGSADWKNANHKS